jgi:heme-degrading monooxygenase HmoA
MKEIASRAVAVFNVFTPKSEEPADLVDLQNTVLSNFRGGVPGLLGSRFYTSHQNKTAVLVSVWEKLSDFEQFRDSGVFDPGALCGRSAERQEATEHVASSDHSNTTPLPVIFQSESC